MSDEKTYWRLNRDVKLSVLLGPFRILMPVIGYAVLYPLLLKYSSLKVVGVWSLISSLVAVTSIGDIGFSQLLTRDAIDRRVTSEALWLDYYTASRFYLLLIGFLSVCVLFLSIAFDSYLATNETAVPLALIIVMVVVSAGLQLINKLDSAILAAKHDYYTVQYVGILAQFFLFIPAILGVVGGIPLEGLACGTLLSSAFSWYFVRRRLPGVFPEFASRIAPAWSETLRHTRVQMIRGRHFYAITLAVLIRLPLTRVVVGGSAGLEGIAIFDIAMRVTQSIRDVVASGLGVLFPAFNKLFRDADVDKLVHLARRSSMALIAIGGLSLTGFALLADWFYELWLGDVPAFLVVTSLVLAGWQLIALLNVPFWFILLASEEERMASISIWCHTILILLAAPLAYKLQASVDQVAMYWAVSSLLTQALIYYHVQRKQKIFWRIAGGLFPPALLVFTSFGFVFSSLTTYSGEPLGAYIVVTLMLQFALSIFVVSVLFTKRNRWLPLLGLPSSST